MRIRFGDSERLYVIGNGIEAVAGPRPVEVSKDLLLPKERMVRTRTSSWNRNPIDDSGSYHGSERRTVYVGSMVHCNVAC